MKTKQKFGRIPAMFLAMALSPLYLLATDYYTKEGSGNGWRIYGNPDAASEGVWVDIDNKPTEKPSEGNNYWIVGAGGFHDGGEFKGDLLSLGLPSDMPDEFYPSWAGSPQVRIRTSSTFNIGDFRLYSGDIHLIHGYLASIAGTTTVHSTSADPVTLRVVQNGTTAQGVSRYIDLASVLKGASDASLSLTAGSWPTDPTHLILSGDFSEYHGSFTAQGALLLLNTATAFGCEADGAKADVYTITADATMAIAADKSASMSRTRGLTIAANKTLTLVTTNDFNGVSYSGYTVTFPISGAASSILAKSGDGTATLDSVCSAGTLRVDSGTLAFGANFETSAQNLVMAAGTQIALAEGTELEFASVTFGEASVAPGFYTGSGGPSAATVLPWISGTGVLSVPYSETPATTVADMWNAEGSAGLMSVASSWVGESAPNLATGEFLPTFANAGSGAVVDTNSVVKGIVFNAANDFALTGTSPLTVLGDGITAAAAESAREYTVSAPLVAGLSQTWSVGENATVAIEGNFGGPRAATVTKTGSGTLDISGANSYPGALAVTEGQLRLSGVFGRSAATDGALSCGSSANITLAGATINKPVSYSQTANLVNVLTAEAGATNVFKGRVSLTGTKASPLTLGDGAVVIFEDGMSVDLNGKNFYPQASETPTVAPLICFKGRPSVVSSSISDTFSPRVTCRFETIGNTIVKCQSALNSGRLEATVDYAWNGTDGIEQFDINGNGFVIDVGSTRQCIQNLTLMDNKYSLAVAGNGGTLELAPTAADRTLNLSRVAFTDSVSLQKHGAEKLTLAGAAVESYGDVTVTNGVLEFAADASWLNGTNVTVSGSGTLKINAAKTFSKDAVIRFADEGKIYVPAGVTQVFAEGWDGDNKMRGTYTTGRVTGGGAIQIAGPGLLIIVR